MYPATPLYILLAISGATLGIYISNAKYLKIKKRFMVLPYLFVTACWFQVTITYIWRYKDLASSPYEFYSHVLILYLFIFSAWMLIPFASKALLHDELPD